MGRPARTGPPKIEASQHLELIVALLPDGSSLEATDLDARLRVLRPGTSQGRVRDLTVHDLETRRDPLFMIETPLGQELDLEAKTAVDNGDFISGQRPPTGPKIPPTSLRDEVAGVEEKRLSSKMKRDLATVFRGQTANAFLDLSPGAKM